MGGERLGSWTANEGEDGDALRRPGALLEDQGRPVLVRGGRSRRRTRSMLRAVVIAHLPPHVAGPAGDEREPARPKG